MPWLGVEAEEALVFLLDAVVVVARTEKRRTARQGPAEEGEAGSVGGPVLRTGTARYRRTAPAPFETAAEVRSGWSAQGPGGQLRVHGDCVPP